MDTKAFRVDIEITAWPHQSRLSSLNEVLIFLNGHVEEFSLSEASGTVGSSLGSKPDPSFRDHQHSLDLENFRPSHVYQRLGNELQHSVLSRLISDRIITESQRTDLPQGQRPLFMMVYVELTRKVYLAVPQEETCAICLEGMSTVSKCKMFICDHPFHEGCIRKWLDRQHDSCPLCRSPSRKEKLRTSPLKES